ncbi:hypothetical protein JHK82_047086 [Glycine max]|uniref:Uncharacterized protein n=2 Tax=Glycine subgen. Soja TaxID=1462606 RepID=K7MKV9_SOYBN|nr:hypothetical protein JHK87_046776 [Glycine soja]KAG4942902.1 hypothetical protein JHK85_047548 [Glycine max]KAG5097232.1 hypothetical protein JHK82_047086 [Glycine max]KAG5102018.1 hypothetical protein JHK84_046987 [Glycine max]KAH1117733.1 hypothetical protein GYH30_046815 [Glycine max]
MCKLWLRTRTRTLHLEISKGFTDARIWLFYFHHEKETPTRQSSISHYSCFQVNSGTVPTKAQTMMLTQELPPHAPEKQLVTRKRHLNTQICYIVCQYSKIVLPMTSKL